MLYYLHHLSDFVPVPLMVNAPPVFLSRYLISVPPVRRP